MLHLLAFITLLGIVFSFPIDHPDRVIKLPGAPADPHFPLYSGLLNVSEKNAEHKIFYVLSEAIRANPSEAPLIVWLNGGPGASSLIGFLLEHGPYLINAESDRLEYNDFSWNQYANVLYIESPSGVGFSYSNRKGVSFDDNITATLNRKALQDFMTRVHPRYATRDFYIAGESYAGVYLPYLAREILNRTATGEFGNRNFKGIAMGNAGVDNFSNVFSNLIQLYSLGMIPEKNGAKIFDLWERILKGERPDPSEAWDILSASRHNIGSSAMYNIPLECNLEEDQTLWHIAKPRRNVECLAGNLTETYFNRPDVQRALHARTVDWRFVSDSVFYAYNQDDDTIPIYKDIVALAQEDFRILFFTGDMDLVCPPLQVAFGARRIAEDNGMRDVTSSENWSYLGDFAGVQTSYRTMNDRVSMDVITVRGAGHMVPVSQPDRAFQIINNFITAAPGTTVDYSKMIPRR